MMTPLLPMYRVQTAAVSDGETSLIISASALTMVLISLLMGPAVQMPGREPVLAAGPSAMLPTRFSCPSCRVWDE